MKLWHLVVLLILLTAGGVVASQEIRYRAQVVEAQAKADTVELMRSQLNVTLETLQDVDQELAAWRVARADSAEAAAQLVNELERELEEQLEVTELVEGALAEHLADDQEGTELAEAVVASHRAEVEALRDMMKVQGAELAAERRLRVQVDSTLFSTRDALEDCLCTLEAAEDALGAFQDVTDGSGWASRAWDSVTSPRGLLTIGVVGLAAYGAWQLLDDGGDVNVYTEPQWSLAVGLPVG